MSIDKDAGEFWAVALSQNGQFLASTSFDGRIDIWDAALEWKKIQTFETRGSFGMTVDIVQWTIKSVSNAILTFLVCGWKVHCQWSSKRQYLRLPKRQWAFVTLSYW